MNLAVCSILSGMARWSRGLLKVGICIDDETWEKD